MALARISEQPGAAPDACLARDVLDRIGDKWSASVIHMLGGETRRFTELLRGIDGISQRMLTVTLRGLERDGIVSRVVHPVVPPRVDYALTPMGDTLRATIVDLVEWAERHRANIAEARVAYDRRARSPAHLAGLNEAP